MLKFSSPPPSPACLLDVYFSSLVGHPMCPWVCMLSGAPLSLMQRSAYAPVSWCLDVACISSGGRTSQNCSDQRDDSKKVKHKLPPPGGNKGPYMALGSRTAIFSSETGYISGLTNKMLTSIAAKREQETHMIIYG